MSVETASQIILAALAVIYSIVLSFEFLLRAAIPGGVAEPGRPGTDGIPP